MDVAIDLDDLTQEIKQANYKFKEARDEIGKVVVGQKGVLDALLVTLLADGHALLEGLPGLAKTLMVTSLAKVMRCDYKRIQFTPDLLPADLLGTSVYNPKEGTFSVKKGPVFTNILLADEINRAPAKVQSALLEVMQERQVTISGETFKVGAPYMVLATQNPIEQEGTYPLAEAQTDRFMMKVRVDYPSKREEKEIMARMATLGEKAALQPLLASQDVLDARKIINAIYIDEKVMDYILTIVAATRNPKEYHVPIENLLMYGASPRATIAFAVAGRASAFMAGRAFVTPDDIKALAHPILRHRLRRSYEAEAEELTADAIIDKILDAIPVP